MIDLRRRLKSKQPPQKLETLTLSNDIQNISIIQLSISLIPVIITICIFAYWQLSPKRAAYAVIRMLMQLMLIGYCLTFIFRTQSSLSTMAVLSIMILCASWIALNVVEPLRHSLLKPTLLAMLVGGLTTLLLITTGVLQLTPWYKLEVVIPLAGMVFANIMTSISLCIERLVNELEHHDFNTARQKAFGAAMIPIINSLLSVGLVSLPGMMTGQILSGVSPLIAVRYQIMVMCMIFGSGGIACSIFLVLAKSKLHQRDQSA